MTRELRLESARHSPQTRLRARELFLLGRSYREISVTLGEEADRAAAETATSKGQTPPKPTPRIAVSLLHYWSKKGSWEAHRAAMQRQLERDQLDRVRADITRTLTGHFAQLAELDAVARSFFLKVEKGADGRAVLDPSGSPVLVPKKPEDFDPVTHPFELVRLMLRVTAARMTYLKFVADLLGPAVPKLDLDTLSVAVPPYGPELPDLAP